MRLSKSYPGDQSLGLIFCKDRHPSISPDFFHLLPYKSSTLLAYFMGLREIVEILQEQVSYALYISGLMI